jgi:hypothetical protein
LQLGIKGFYKVYCIFLILFSLGVLIAFLLLLALKL